MDCPQCHTALETITLADGMELRQCPRCGWSDAASAGPQGYATPSAQVTGESAAGRSSRTARIIMLVVLVDIIITIGIVAVLLVFKTR